MIDTKTYALIKNIPADNGANDLWLSDDGRVLTVNNFYANSFTTIDTTSLTGITTPAQFGAPQGAVAIPLK